MHDGHVDLAPQVKVFSMPKVYLYCSIWFSVNAYTFYKYVVPHQSCTVVLTFFRLFLVLGQFYFDWLIIVYCVFTEYAEMFTLTDLYSALLDLSFPLNAFLKHYLYWFTWWVFFFLLINLFYLSHRSGGHFFISGFFLCVCQQSKSRKFSLQWQKTARAPNPHI